MTIVSAASLPGHGQAAPFTAFRSSRRERPRAIPGIATATAWRRQSPGVALADDPPRGRILIVADRAPLTLQLQRILRDAGYRAVGPVASAEEAERLADRRRLDAALVDAQLENGRADEVADWLAQRGTRLVWLTDALDKEMPRRLRSSPAVAKPVDGQSLVGALEDALSSGRQGGGFYPVPPPQQAWPRVFPQL